MRCWAWDAGRTSASRELTAVPGGYPPAGTGRGGNEPIDCEVVIRTPLTWEGWRRKPDPGSVRMARGSVVVTTSRQSDWHGAVRLPVDQPGQVAQQWPVVDVADGDRDAEVLPHPQRQAGREQRMPTEREEVVLRAD